MNRIGTTKVVGCPRMVKTALSQKCASSNGRFRKKLTLIPLVPLPQEQPDCHHHPHHHGSYKRSCHGHCSKSKTLIKPEIKISDLLFGKEKMKLPKIKKNDFINDPNFQEGVIRDLLALAETKKNGKHKPLIGDIKKEIFMNFKFEKKKVDSIVNYIDTILNATEKTKENAQTTLNFMQETRDKCQKLDIEMEDFFEGVRESLTFLRKADAIN